MNLRIPSISQAHSLIYGANVIAWLLILQAYSVETLLNALVFACMTFIPCSIIAGGIMFCFDGLPKNSRGDMYHYASIASPHSSRHARLIDKL